MPRYLVFVATAMAACARPSAEPVVERPFQGDPWPAIRVERIRTLLPEAMDRSGLDAWIVVCRENDNDPLARHVGGENAGGEALFLFFRTEEGLHSIAVSPAGEATALAEIGLHDEVLVPGGGAGAWDLARAALDRFGPDAIAVNSGRSPIADGLSHAQRQRLEAEIGAEWSQRLVSSEPLVIEWLGIKTPAEIEILRRAAELTARWEIEAYATVVPGETTDRQLADVLEAKMAAAGVGDGWAPAQNPAINSGKDRGHSHPTDRVILPGDFIQTDFGIQVHGMWMTDIQRFAYVLAPGETEPPAEALARWEAAKRGSRAAFSAMRPGATGYDVDRAQRDVMSAEGSLPVPWSTGHPVGY